MRILMCDTAVDDPIPEHWLASAVTSVHGHARRFGLVDVADTVFDTAADHNRQHVLVRVLAFSLNYRDTAFLLGDLGRGLSDSTRGLGSDFVAEVMLVGREVTNFRPGDRVVPAMHWPPDRPADPHAGVVTNTSSRELLRLPAEQLAVVPTSVPNDVAAAFALGAQTAYGMVRRAAVRPGERVLVTAPTSNTSLFALGALRARGAEVYALSRSGRCPAESGVRAYFDTSPEGLRDLAQLARELRGFDVVLDPFSDAYLLLAVKLMGFSSRYVTCRLPAVPPDSLSAPAAGGAAWAAAISSLVAKNATVLGHCLGQPSDLAAAFADWEAGLLQVPIDSTHSAAEIGSFLHRSLVADDRLGKVVYHY